MQRERYDARRAPPVPLQDKASLRDMFSWKNHQSSQAYCMFVAVHWILYTLIYAFLGSEHDDFFMHQPVRYEVRGRLARYVDDTWAAGLVSIIAAYLFLLLSTAYAFHNDQSYTRVATTPSSADVRDFVISYSMLGVSHAFLFFGIAYYTGQNDIFQLIAIALAFVARGGMRAALHSKDFGHASMTSRVQAAMSELVLLLPVGITFANRFELDAFKTLPVTAGATPADASGLEEAAIWIWVSAELVGAAHSMLAYVYSNEHLAYVTNQRAKIAAGNEDSEQADASQYTSTLYRYTGITAILSALLFVTTVTSWALAYAGPTETREPVYTVTVWRVGSVVVDEWRWAIIRYFVPIASSLFFAVFAFRAWQFYRAYKNPGIGHFSNAVHNVMYNLNDPLYMTLDCVFSWFSIFALCHASGIEDLMEAIVISTMAAAGRTAVNSQGYRVKWYFAVPMVCITLTPYAMLLTKALDVTGDIENGVWATLIWLTLLDTGFTCGLLYLCNTGSKVFADCMDLVMVTRYVTLTGRAVVWAVGIWYAAFEHSGDALARTG
jgi:hypothetical protein